MENIYGNIITTISASDGLNTVNHDITISINNIEDEATGILDIIGIVAEGNTLTADTSSNIDQDTNGNLSFTFPMAII